MVLEVLIKRTYLGDLNAAFDQIQANIVAELDAIADDCNRDEGEGTK